MFKALIEELLRGEVTQEEGDGYRTLAEPEKLGDEALDALCELAYLTIRADDAIEPEEEQLLATLFEELLAKGPGAYGKQFDTYTERARADGRTGRLTACSLALRNGKARRLGYALVSAITSVDLARSPKEERFENQVAQVFGLDDNEREQLELLVMSKLSLK